MKKCSTKVISHGTHYCELPGWRERKRCDIRPEALIACCVCGKVWRWGRDVYPAGFGWLDWTERYAEDGVVYEDLPGRGICAG